MFYYLHQILENFITAHSIEEILSDKSIDDWQFFNVYNTIVLNGNVLLVIFSWVFIKYTCTWQIRVGRISDTKNMTFFSNVGSVGVIYMDDSGDRTEDYQMFQMTPTEEENAVLPPKIHGTPKLPL